MKKVFLVLIIIITVSCQRDIRNNLGVGYNKTLIIPPTDDLPVPNSSNNNEFEGSSNPVISNILNQTDAINSNPDIAEKIDNDSGYETDQLLLDRLFKGKKK